MDRKKKILNLIVDQGLLPLYYHPDSEVSIQVLRALYSAGFRAVEYSNQGDQALENFLRLRKVVDTELPDMQLGAGTIKNKIEATEFINEGAQFIVCPGVVDEVAALVHKNDLLWVPYCMTFTEMLRAEELEASLVKLFPATAPSFLTEVRETFPGLLFMMAGGVEINEEALTECFNDGVHVVGLGSKLIRMDWLETGDYASIELAGRDALQVTNPMKKAYSV